MRDRLLALPKTPHGDPYTFADDLAENIADENDHRSAEELLLATIDATTDDKLTRFALQLALSGHVSIPRENELDFLVEAEAVFLLFTAKSVKAYAAASNKPTPTHKKVVAKQKPTKTIAA